MAEFKQMYITNKGKSLFAKVQSGTVLNFTKVKLGSGDYGTQNPENLTGLIDEKMDGDITAVVSDSTNQVARISVRFTNDDILTATYIEEIGLYAQDPDEGEILYAYASAGTKGDYISPSSAGPYTWQYQITIGIGNASSVTASLSNLIYDYGVQISDTSLKAINGGNQLEINKKVDNTVYNLNKNKNNVYTIQNVTITPNFPSSSYDSTLKLYKQTIMIADFEDYKDYANLFKSDSIITINPHIEQFGGETLNVLLPAVQSVEGGFIWYSNSVAENLADFTFDMVIERKWTD